MIINLITMYRNFLRQLMRHQLGLVLIPIIILLMIGTFGYSTLEGWSLLDALYATIITVTTVGYGDLSPVTAGGRIFAIFFVLSAIGMASYAISAVATRVIQNAVDVTEDEHLSLAKLAEKVDIPYLLAEPTEDSTLIAAGIGRAKGVVASLDSDERNLFTVVSARALSQRLDNIKLRIVALVHDDKNGTKLQVAGADQLVLPEKGSGQQIQMSMMNPRLADFALHTSVKGTAGYALQQLENDPAASWVSKTVANLSAEKQLVVLAIWRNGNYLYSPSLDTQLQADDELIVFAASQQRDIFGQSGQSHTK